MLFQPAQARTTNGGRGCYYDFSHFWWLFLNDTGEFAILPQPQPASPPPTPAALTRPSFHVHQGMDSGAQLSRTPREVSVSSHPL